jgi:hypothetical protein
MQMNILKSKLICSFEECNNSFKTYQLHLNIRHMVDIINNTLNFKIFEGNNNITELLILSIIFFLLIFYNIYT